MNVIEIEENVRSRFREEALVVFRGNPIWRRRHDAAPAGARAYYAALFANALHTLVEVRDEEWHRITCSMNAADWRYMAESTGSGMAKAFYERAATMVEESGCPVSAGGPEILNPFVDLEEA